jgi:uncharacterized iron-regulated membrane protein
MTKKKKKKDFKFWVGKAHLWLGLASGLIVLLLGVTGCIFAFSQEITHALRHDAMYVQDNGKQPLPPSALWNIAQKALGKEKPMYGITLYKDRTKAAMFGTYKVREGSIFALRNLEYYQTVYVNQYNGKVLGIYDEENDFFNVIKVLHYSLLLESWIGQPITAYATLIFVIMLITGVVLWWPKNKAARKQRVWFRWKNTTKWRRKNYDLHNISGFYAALVALVIAVSGMMFYFEWVQAVVFVAANAGGTSRSEAIAAVSVPAPGSKELAFDKAFAFAQKHYAADAESFGSAMPADKKAPITLYANKHDGTYYANHQLQFDQYTGKLLAEKRFEENNLGEQVVGAKYDIHVGAILGLPGKILAFIISLISAMLPVTGFIIWYGRTYKKTAKA